MSDVIKEIEESQSKKYGRGKSWEHCYLFFRDHEKFSNNEGLLDFAALHLGFFIASWGMLRGSSFLLQKDYKFYVPVVEILINKKYDKLWNINFLATPQEEDISLLFQLKKELENKISENYKAEAEDNKEEHEMNLIITKIIMGTMGCVPGYDQYFKNGVKIEFNKNCSFNKKSFKNLLDLVKNDKFKNIFLKSPSLKRTNIKYPSMKLLDLYFWLLGKQKEMEK